MIRINLDVMLARRKMSLTELADRVGITLANLSVLKTARQRRCALRRSTPSAAPSPASRAISWNSLRKTDMDNTLESPRPVFGVRECLMLPAALCLGILWRNVFTLEGLADLAFGPHPGPALGAAVFTALIWAFVLLFLGKSVRWDG